MSRGKSSTSGAPGIGSMGLGVRRAASGKPRLLRRRRHGPLLVAADAAQRLAGLDRREALHPLDRQVVLVQGDEEQAPQRRHFEVGRAVGFDRHRAEHPLQGERAAVAQRVHAAGEVDRLGQAFQHQQLLDLARLDAGHVAAVVDVVRAGTGPSAGRGRRAAGMTGSRLRGDQRPRLVQPDVAELLRQREERVDRSRPVHQHERVVLRRQERVVANAHGSRKSALAADRLQRGQIVRPALHARPWPRSPRARSRRGRAS